MSLQKKPQSVSSVVVADAMKVIIDSRAWPAYPTPVRIFGAKNIYKISALLMIFRGFFERIDHTSDENKLEVVRFVCEEPVDQLKPTFILFRHFILKIDKDFDDVVFTISMPLSMVNLINSQLQIKIPV